MSIRGQLESLHLKNFKSFAGKHKIGPFQNFTAIIGPNGGGKSNIMDAISFVLGVRSSDLRASNLKELIYRQESEKLSDLTRDSSVKIIFRADSTKEIHFKRTISSTGLSDYFINKSKESNETYLQVLSSYNILTKAKNFLIFQGQVDALAMKSGKELTLLFEKISGSEEMKVEYETSKGQVEACEENLKSINSKITFLKGEKKKLKEQKTHAINYEKGVDRIRDLQGKYYLLQFSGIEVELDRKKKNLQNKVDELDGLRKIKEDSILQMRECGSNLKQTEQKLGNIVDDMGSKSGLMFVKKPDIVKLTENVRQFEGRIGSKMETVEKMKAGLQREIKRFRDLNEELKVFEEEIQIQQELLDQELHTAINESNKKEFLRLKKEFGIRTFAEQKELETLMKEIDTKEISASLIAQRLKENQIEKFRLDSEIEDHHRLLSLKKSERSKIESLKSLKIDDLKSASLEFTTLKKREDELLLKIRTLDSKIRDFCAVETCSKYIDREKQVIEEILRLKKGVRGILGDLITPIQPRYSLAMQAGLGSVLNYLVIDSFEIAGFVIQKLKDAGITKEVIILENLPEVHKSETLRQSVSKYGSLLIDILTYNKEYGLEKAVNLFARSKAFADNLDSAAKLRTIKGIKQVVTIDGVCIKSGMICSAPAKRRVEKVSQKRGQAEKEMEDLRNELVTIQLITRGENSVDVIKKSVEEFEKDLRALELEIERIDRSVEEKMIRRKEVKIKIIEFEQQQSYCNISLDKFKQSVQTISKILKTIENDTFSKFCTEIGVESIQLLEARNPEQVVQIQNKINSLKKESAKTSWSLKSISLDTMKESIQKLQESIEKDHNELKNLKKKLSKDTEDFEKLTEVCKVLKEQESFLKDQVIKQKQLHENVHKNYENSIRACNKAEKDFSNEEREYDHLKQQKEQKIEELLVKNLDIPFIFKKTQKDIDFSKLDNRYFKMPISEIEKEAEEISKAIEKESKNLEALASNAKCTFQADKLKDIEKKLDEANKTLEGFDKVNKESKAHFLQIKEKRRSQFMQTFDIVGNNIGRIYKDMTKSEKNTYYGGNALLYVDNTEEPYNGGVIYSPTPPGKRCMYEMDQLSGGEKTIAALSLLFAIHSAMPSPFYIMDEVDAFLDWENCQLLLNYLNQISEKKSQCVIITHKEEFFSNADNIIGTTYVPSENTSKSFSLDLGQFGPKQIVIV